MRRIALLIAAAAALVASPPPAAADVTVSAFGNADGTLRLPEAVAVAPDGTVLVGDHHSGRIQLFRGGRFAGAFGMSGDRCGRLGAVSGVARSADGRVFVLDADEQRVHVFGPDGAVVRCFGGNGNGRGRLRTSSGSYAASSASGGIAVAGSYVYVADWGNDRVQRFTLDGSRPKVIGRGRLSQPQGLAVRDGRLLVADDGSHRVLEFTASGRFVRATGERLRFPYDVALAANGHAYVADNNGHRIVELDRRLRRVRSWGGQGSGPSRFTYPRSVAVGPDGHVFVADTANDRVTEFTARGRYVRTIGSNGRRPGAVTAPADVAVNARGEVAVADGNQRIAWFSLGGQWLGRWAQGRSFQSSTAIVTAPRSLDFPADDRLRVVDAGTVLQFGPGEARELLDARAGRARVAQKGLGGREPGAPAALRARAVDVGPDGTTWVLTGTGRIAPMAADGRVGAEVGEQDPRDRVSTDLAVLSDGTIAVAEGAAENRPQPADGVIRRYDATGRALPPWPFPRPAGGDASKPSGLVSDGMGGVWVSDAANGRVVRLGPDGAALRTLGSPGAALGELAVPAGLTLDCAGGLLVADAGNNRVVRFTGEAFGAPPPGCAPAPSPPTAASRPPGPAGLKLRTTFRPSRPARVLARFRTSCTRRCTVRALAIASSFGVRAGAATVELDARVSGRSITVVAGARELRRMRTMLRRSDRVRIGLTAEATTADGVRDIETTGVTLRRS